MQIYLLLFSTLLSSLSEGEANNSARVGCWGQLCTYGQRRFYPVGRWWYEWGKRQEERLAELFRFISRTTESILNAWLNGIVGLAMGLDRLEGGSGWIRMVVLNQVEKGLNATPKAEVVLYSVGRENLDALHQDVTNETGFRENSVNSVNWAEGKTQEAGRLTGL